MEVILPGDDVVDTISQDVSALTVENDNEGSPSQHEFSDFVEPNVLFESISSSPTDLESPEQIAISTIVDIKESETTGQVVKLPPISVSSKLRNSKGILAPGVLATRLSSKTTSNSTATTQLTVYSSQNNKSSGSTISRNTFPSDCSPTVTNQSIVKARQLSINRSSISSATGPLPEMKVASIKMQMTNKKTVPKSVSVSTLGNNYRYKIMPGNNSRVVMTAMRKRPWWHAILGNNAAEDDQNDLSAIQPTFLWEMIRRACRYRSTQFHNTLMNHIQRNACLVTKKGLYLSLKSYCQEQQLDLLSIVPRTYYLAPGEHSKSMKDDDMEDFLQFCQNHPEKSPEELVWILKPASKTNRGFGIKVVQGLDRVINIVQRGMSANSTEGRDTCAEAGESGEEDDDDDEQAAIVVNKAASGSSNNNPLAAYDANPLSKQARMIARTDGYIVQAYLERPLLVHGRKFDIRCFVLVTVLPARRNTGGAALPSPTANLEAGAVDEDTRVLANSVAAVQEQLPQANSSSATPKQSKKVSTNAPSSPGRARNPSGSSKPVTFTGRTVREKEIRAYFFQDAYIRTSCKKYVNGNFSDRETHLTNDAVQKHAKSYGHFEEGNKLSLLEWEQVLLEEYPHVSRPGIVMDQIFPEIKRLSKLSIASVASEFAMTDINKSFELFGYDYMIREDLSPVLIEVNTNPCLEFVCPLLTQVITDVIEHTVRLTVDKELPPPPKSVRTRATEEAIESINSVPLRFDVLYP